MLPIAGQSCQLQVVDVHLEGTTDPKNPAHFSGLMRVTTSTLRPEACICQAWFEYQAIRSTNENICP